MSGKADELAIVTRELDETLELLERNRGYYASFVAGEGRSLASERTRHIVIAEILERYYTCLQTLFLRFRHFKRYYLELDYDRDRIEYMEKLHARVHDKVRADLERFRLFLQELAAQLTSPEDTA